MMHLTNSLSIFRRKTELLLSKLAPERFRYWKSQIDFVKSYYRTRMKRELSLFRPKRFSEKMQWRKLFEASDLHTRLTDKLASRVYIAEKGFYSMIIHPLWTGTDPKRIPYDQIQCPFVIKSTHASNHVIIVRDYQSINTSKIINLAQKWLSHCHGTALREPGYLNIPRQLVIEPLLLCSNGEPPAELKILTFDGIAKCSQYIKFSRGRDQTFAFLDRDWKPYDWRGASAPLDRPERPLLYDQALRVAEKLCEGTNHCRVDFYLRDNDLYVGELTLYSWTGMVTLKPEEADIVMGAFWTIKWPTIRAIHTMITRDWGSVRQGGDGDMHRPMKRFSPERIGPSVTTIRSPGELRGKVDGSNGARVWGWAQSLALPDAPVCLEVVLDGAVVAVVYADLPREDLARAGIGDGHHAFNLILSEAIPIEKAHTVVVRRAADGSVLKNALA